MEALPSTAIRDFRYDARSRTLDVTFVSERRYRYIAVPADVAAAFEIAESKGGFFNARIRDVFAFKELTRGRP
ncbi:KTSC domain-containing protein [Novosphingobium sp. 9U]|uniref:KTSC domain-containing protein n=1 Tax=Novosphingobium sp. 9U TaxID=2653158 RepID=UPI001F3D4ADB|nr:KTSC domain-containing protein [Novosphingobium sp. 9U]